MEYTIKNAKENMTLFYTKSNGDIKGYCSGIQTMSYFGENETDFSQIWDFKVFPIDKYVIDNWQKFTINLTTLAIELKHQDIPQYPIATS